MEMALTRNQIPHTSMIFWASTHVPTMLSMVVSASSAGTGESVRNISMQNMAAQIAADTASVAQNSTARKWR